MKSLLSFAAVGILALAANGQAPEPKITKAMYMVTGLHCAPCVTTVEGSLKKTKGVKSIKGDFNNKSATIEFDESVISAQEVARAMSVTPHMMGRGMQYGGILLLSVPGVKDQATGKKTEVALTKVEGVAKVTLYPQQQAVGIQFTGKGTVTTKQLIEALEAAGLKGSQYGAFRPTNGPSDQAMIGGSSFMSDHPGMVVGNGAMANPSAMGQRLGWVVILRGHRQV